MNLHAELEQFCGTEEYHRHGLARNVLFTDGVQYLMEHGKCFWLGDAIASHLPNVATVSRKHGEDFASFHIWLLRKDGNGAVLTAHLDKGTPAKITQKIEYTDFPFPEDGVFKLYVGQQDTFFVVMLPSEY